MSIMKSCSSTGSESGTLDARPFLRFIMFCGMRAEDRKEQKKMKCLNRFFCGFKMQDEEY